MVTGAVVAQPLLGGAVRVPQRLGAEAAGLETAAHGGDVLVATLVRGAADGQRLVVQAQRLDGARCDQRLGLERLGAPSASWSAGAGSPCQATSEPPVGSTTATCTLWRLSSSPPRTTVTVISAYRTGDAGAAGTGSIRPRPARAAERGADRVGAGRALRDGEDDRSADRRSLVGRRFSDVGRRAKRLLFETDVAGPVLMVHLMSAGRLAVGRTHPSRRCSAVAFEDGIELAMSEAGRKRRAGAWLLTPAGGRRAAGAHRPGAARSRRSTRPRRCAAALDAAPAPAARVPARPAGDRRHRPRLRERDPARGAALPLRARRDAHDEQLERLHAAIVGQLGDAVERLVPLSQQGPGRPRPARGYAVHDRLGEAVPGVRE